MSMWGVWCDDVSNEIHIVPCDPDGHVIGGHRRTGECFCRPESTYDCPEVIVHKDPERGGTNA